MLDDTEEIVLLDVKSFKMNVPVSEAIEIALRCLYSCDRATDMERSTLKLN